MDYRGYSEQDLVSNRAAVLIFGGTDAERREWAREAAGHFAAEGPMVEVNDAQALQAALGQSQGAVFIPDLIALGPEAQGQVLQCLRGIEERPKLILALQTSLEGALPQLREDLAYRLQLAHVNLDSAGLREAIRSRRQAKEEELASVKTLVQAPAAKAAEPRRSKKKPPAKAKKAKKKPAGRAKKKSYRGGKKKAKKAAAKKRARPKTKKSARKAKGAKSKKKGKKKKGR